MYSAEKLVSAKPESLSFQPKYMIRPRSLQLRRNAPTCCAAPFINYKIAHLKFFQSLLCLKVLVFGAEGFLVPRWHSSASSHPKKSGTRIKYDRIGTRRCFWEYLEPMIQDFPCLGSDMYLLSFHLSRLLKNAYVIIWVPTPSRN